MDLEVLVSTMNQDDYQIIKEMNLQSNAIIINQCGRVNYKEIEYKVNKIKFIDNNNVGIGRSRNMALLESTADICILADDDMIYHENYKDIILNEFKENKDADVIIFNIKSLNVERPSKANDRKFFINRFNYMKYGAVRIAFRRKSIIKNNIYFSLMFGGGAKYGSGEDTLFLKKCLDSKLKILTSDKFIADIKQEESCWFNGYNEKYFKDKGALIKALYGKVSIFYCFGLLLKWKKLYKNNYSMKYVFKLLLQGAKEY